jgi:signal transduction histidine kinase
MMPRSIRARLTLGVTGAALLILLASGWLIYRGTERNTFGQIDEALIEHAELMARQVEFERGTIVLEHGDRFETTPGGIDHGAFRIWIQDGGEIARYPRLDDDVFPRFSAGAAGGSAPAFRNFEHPDRGKMRAVSIQTVPTYNPRPGQPAPANLDAKVHIAVAHDISSTLAGLTNLRNLLVAIGIVTFALLALIIHFLIRSAMRPIGLVKEELAARDRSELASEIDQREPLPTELEPLVASFNALLARIREASDRERQFTSSAAHELRTPLAALTSILEQAVRRDRSPEESRNSFERSLATTRDMNQLVERLLTLSRFDRADPEIEVSDVPLEILVEGAIETFSEAAAARNLKIDFDLPDGLTASTDPALLQVVINNLLENAINYADEGSQIRIIASNGGTNVTISVENQSSDCDSQSARRVFEPFWRADKVRSRPGLHAGLGLSICEKIVAVIGGMISAKSEDGGAFSVTVQIPASA